MEKYDKNVDERIPKFLGEGNDSLRGDPSYWESRRSYWLGASRRHRCRRGKSERLASVYYKNALGYQMLLLGAAQYIGSEDTRYDDSRIAEAVESLEKI